MIIYVKTSKHRSAATLAIDSDDFKNLADEYWPIADDVQNDADRYWKFKLALRECGELLTTSTPPQLTLMLTKDRSTNNSEIDRMIYVHDFEKLCTEVGAEPIASDAAAFQTFNCKPNDNMLYCARLSVLVHNEEISDFLVDLDMLLHKYDKTASAVSKNAVSETGIDKLIKEMENK